MIRSVRLGRAPNCSSLGNVVNTLVLSQAALTALFVAAEAWRARRQRPEPDGGETRAISDPPALVRTGTENGAPHEAHVQITRACALPCPACHIEPSPTGAHVPTADIAVRFAALAERGVFHVAVGGGEALLHPDLPGVVAAARAAGLSIGLTTSGVGNLGPALGFDQVNISYDAGGSAFQASRGYPGAERALAAIGTLASEGVAVGVNVLLDRHTFSLLPQTVAEVVAAGARDVHLLRLKPSGRAVESYAERRLLPEQALAVWPTLQALMVAHPGVTFRVDCAMTPYLAAHDVEPARMEAVGWTGCHGGDALVAVDTAGGEAPCSFVRGPPTAQWRLGVETEPCGSCAWQRLCRGGCHAVSAHVTGNLFAPDPECPRVLAATVARAAVSG